MIKAKHKFLLYKQFNLDIWGYLKSNLWRQKRRLPKKFKKKKKGNIYLLIKTDKILFAL